VDRRANLVHLVGCQCILAEVAEDGDPHAPDVDDEDVVGSVLRRERRSVVVRGRDRADRHVAGRERAILDRERPPGEGGDDPFVG